MCCRQCYRTQKEDMSIRNKQRALLHHPHNQPVQVTHQAVDGAPLLPGLLLIAVPVQGLPRAAAVVLGSKSEFNAADVTLVLELSSEDPTGDSSKGDTLALGSINMDKK